MKTTLRVNGKDRDVDVPRRATLLSVLREDLGLTGARFGCEPGAVAISAAIANAVFAATGVRVRQLQMTPERVRG